MVEVWQWQFGKSPDEFEKFQEITLA